MNSHRPLEWFIANWDGLVLALVIAFSASSVTMALRGARGITILIALLSSFMLTGMFVPLAAIYWGLPWPFWPAISGVIGITSLSVMWFAIKFADRIQSRAPDIADGVGRRWLPEMPDPPPDRRDGGGPQP